MNKKFNRKQNMLKVMTLSVAMALVNSAGAAELKLGNGWEGYWNNTVSVSSSWRAKDRDPALYTQSNGATLGLPQGSGGSFTDAGNLNYDKGDQFSQLYKLISELSLSNGNMGALLRVKGWYDKDLNEDEVRFGHQGNRYTPNARLNDEGWENLQRFSGVELMDAYVYNSFDLGRSILNARIGRQVVNWGESLFIQGINQTNPIDVPSLRKPGTQIKEVLIPQWMLYGNLGLENGMSIEAFYQLKWENTPVDSCGTYFSPVEGNISTGLSSCRLLTIADNGKNAATSSMLQNSPAAVALVNGREAKDDGQFGLALRFPVEAIDSDVGLYFQNIHSRTPIVSGVTATTRFPVGTPGGLGGRPIPSTATGFWEYPEDIQIFGASLGTNLLGWSMGSEISYSKDVPAQINGNDLIAAAGFQALPPGGNGSVGPAGSLVQAAGFGGNYFPGFVRVDKTQLNINGVKLFSSVMGAEQLTVIGEAAFQWADLPSDVRIGRAFIFGTGGHATYPGALQCNPGLNNNQAGMCNEGYATEFSWGYRLRAEWSYTNVFNTGVTVLPSIYWAQDVDGTSIDNQLIEDRTVTGLGMKFSFAKRYNLSMGYTIYGNGAAFDPLRDRDFYSLSFDASF